ncbi:MAG: RNA polymerase sigma factor RpoD/SigA [Lentisphaeria bacterium]|nr:RNA polymerase sigma factor RpoD/SigA [Lentisphaeria bacterium]
MQSYMNSIGQYELISTKREKELAARIARGDDDARNELICANLRLAVKIAHDFTGRGLPLDDLVAEGNTGIMRAAERFDPAKGAKFSTYSAWWIRQAMNRAIANQRDPIRIPVQTATKLRAIRDAETALQHELAREPTSAELAERTDLTVRTVNALRGVRVNTVSLDAPMGSSDDTNLAQVVPDPNSPEPGDELAHCDDLEQLRNSLQALPARDRRILALRFGLAGEERRTLEEVSQEFDLSRERIRQIQSEALGTLRQHMAAA